MLCIDRIDTIIRHKGNIMASIVDSIRAVYIDNYSMLKLGVFSYIIYFLYTLIQKTSGTWIINLPFILGIVLIYVGFASVIMHNRIQQNLATLPMINPILFLTISAKSIAVILPYLVIGLPLVSFVVGLFNFDGVPQQIAIGIIQLIVCSVSLTALIYFAKDYDIQDGYNLSKVFTGFQDVLVFVFLCLLMLAIVNVFIAIPLLYLTYSFLDIGPVFFYVCSFLITMNIAFLADYCGQLSFDLDSRNNYY